MIEHELRSKLNNKKKCKNSLLKNGSRKKKKIDGNVDVKVNIKSISTNSSTLEELYRITSNLETPAGSDGDATTITTSKSDSGNRTGTSSSNSDNAEDSSDSE